MVAQSLTLTAWGARRLPDDNVFERTLRGDPVAFSEVYRRYQKRIYGFCLARSLDPDTAADATQEVFMKLLRAEPGSIENPRAWLFTVARNVVIDVIRRRGRTPEDAGLDEESLAWDRLKAADTSDEVLARADARNVFLALRTLRPRYRTALIMREVHGQSAKDMAEALETSPGAVDTLVSRARDAFGIAYAAMGDLPQACRTSTEFVYRRLGTGISDSEQMSLDAHLAECERCRAESKRAGDPRHLAALLPFLVPAKQLARGIIERAALTVRAFPDVAVHQGAAVLGQPHSWSLATKVAAVAVTAVLIGAPIVATTTHRTTSPEPSRSSSRGGPISPWDSRSGAVGYGWPWSARTGAAGPDTRMWSSGWSPTTLPYGASASMTSMWSDNWGQRPPSASPGSPTSGSAQTGWSSGGMSASGGWTPPTTTTTPGSSSTSRPRSGTPSSGTHMGSTSGSTSPGSGSTSSGSGSMSSGGGSWSSSGGSQSMGGSGGW